MELLVPILLLLGLSSLIFADNGGSSSSADGVAGDSGSGTEDDAPDTPVTQAPVTNFLDLTEDDDTEEGTDADDVIRAFAGDDSVSGGTGDDRIFLGDGDDLTVVETEGDDLIRGGGGNDLILDDEGANTLYGDLGNDLLASLDDSNDPSEADSLFGGFGADVLLADEGDVVSGGNGTDFFGVAFANDGEPTTISDYEAGEEIVLALPAVFEDTEVTITPDDAGEDMLINVGTQTAIILKGITDPDDVNVSLSGEDVTAVADAESDFIVGTDDADTIDTGFGQDIVLAGDGDDVIDGGRETDQLYGGNGDDNIAGNGGSDLIRGGYGDDLIRAGAGDDIVIDRQGEDSVRGGSGDDILDVRDEATSGSDDIAAGEGNDLILSDDGDTLRLGAGNDLAVVSVEDVTDAPVTIKDFNPVEDFLRIGAGDGTGVLAVAPQADGNGTSVTVDGQEVAILSGVVLSTPVNMDVVPLIDEATS